MPFSTASGSGETGLLSKNTSSGFDTPCAIGDVLSTATRHDGDVNCSDGSGMPAPSGDRSTR
jgi:hypothetical protein